MDEVERAKGGGFKGCGRVGASVATLVEGYGMIASGGELREDLAPGVGEFWKA